MLVTSKQVLASILVIAQSLGQSEYLPHFRIFIMLMAKLFFALIIEVGGPVFIYSVAEWKFSDFQFFMALDLIHPATSRRFKKLVLACALYTIVSRTLKTLDYSFYEEGRWSKS